MDPLKMFDEWVSNCKESHAKFTQRQNQHEFLDSIESAAKEYFGQLDHDENKKDIKSKQLAQLLAKLGPPLSASSSTSSCSKLSALHYILGSLNGIIPTAMNAGTCTNSINTNICLQKSLVELLGKFLLQYCGPLILTSETAMDVQNIEDDGVNNNDPATAADYANSDFSEEIRDCATQCISALLKIPIAVSDDINSDVIETEAEVEAKTVEHKSLDLDSSIQFRIQLAQDAIRKRCANLEDCDDDDEEDDDDYNYGQNGGELEREATTLSNLSLLPRSRRSLCFQILNCVIQGIQNQCDFHMVSVSDMNGNEGRACNLKLIASGVIGIMIQFAAFCAHCLHGETDPRCLIQMLKILNRLQIVFAPLMEGSSASTSGGAESKFPYNEVLDAVAVYYPVRFTPPRNDPHGITREGIHSALMDVLCCSSRLELTVNIDSNAGGDKSATVDLTDEDITSNMTVLAAGLFLERLAPPTPMDIYGDNYGEDDEKEVSTVRDRIESLEDLTTLLLVPLITDSNDAGGEVATMEMQQRILSKLNIQIVREMSNVLFRCHEEAATGVATAKNDDEKKENKSLADSCRHFAMSMAYELERHVQMNVGARSMWNVFVKDRVRDLASIIASSPQSLKGRMAIAYLASLSACSGIKTLRLCLDASIPKLAGLLEDSLKASEKSNRDEEKMSTAAYGISVLFSSCRLSMDQITKDGVSVSPHPLRPYGSQIVQLLCRIINDTPVSMDTDGKQEPPFGELEVSAIKSLESVLLSTPALILNQPDEEDTATVSDAVLYLAKMLVASIASNVENDENWKLACARMVGSTIGKAMKGAKDIGNGPDATLLESDREIISFVQENLFPKILESSVTPFVNDGDGIERYDWMVLASACETDQEYAVVEIISNLYDKLGSSINDPKTGDVLSEAATIAGAISHLLTHGGPKAYSAFHAMPQGDQAGNGVLNVLATYRKNQSVGAHAMEEMSNLLLPETRDEYRSQAEKAIKLSYSILPHLLPAYNKEVPSRKIEEMVSRVSQVLPPLSDWDGVELSTILPILSVALSTNVSLEKKTIKQLELVVLDLVEYVFNMEEMEASRAAAAACIFSIIAKYQVDDDRCLGLELLKTKLCPVIFSSIKMLTRGKGRDGTEEQMQMLEEAMNLAALVASAACRRGKASATTADEVARLLVLISCEDAASAPALGITTPLDCTGDSIENDFNKFEITAFAASALGSIISVESGNPFVKQRLAYKVVPIILSGGYSQAQTLNNTRFGCLMCASFIICCVPVKAIGQQKFDELALIIVRGLDEVVGLLCDEINLAKSPVLPKRLQDLISLLLTAILMIYNQVPSTIISNLGTITPAALLINLLMKDICTASLNLLAIQVLHSITDSSDDRVIHFRENYKATLLKHLKRSLDHPSSQVRQAAVQTINIWSVIE